MIGQWRLVILALLSLESQGSAAHSVVFFHNHLTPSNLHFNVAKGAIAHEKGTSDIVRLFLYPAHQTKRIARASALLISKEDIRGYIILTQDNPPLGPTTLSGTISGLSSDGIHGLSIYESGDLAEGCQLPKRHFDPYRRPHGPPTGPIHHTGDLGNIVSNNEGIASVDITAGFSLVGPNSVIGRALAVHVGPDDYGLGPGEESQRTGNMGPAVACGVIGRAP